MSTFSVSAALAEMETDINKPATAADVFKKRVNGDVDMRIYPLRIGLTQDRHFLNAKTAPCDRWADLVHDVISCLTKNE
ncbi:MAG TPA: hypothetical protein VM659_05200 [Dongiaceae bacterium]|nr:hypothetical protein [Dongiaceae bacterium]